MDLSVSSSRAKALDALLAEGFVRFESRAEQFLHRIEDVDCPSIEPTEYYSRTSDSGIAVMPCWEDNPIVRAFIGRVID
jgi:hypothetical protein